MSLAPLGTAIAALVILIVAAASMASQPIGAAYQLFYLTEVLSGFMCL